MASGCPVITTHNGSLAEIAGDAAVVVSGHNCLELLAALDHVQAAGPRATLVEAGLERVARIDRDEGVTRFLTLLKRAHAESQSEAVIEFHRNSKRIRAIQAELDVGID